MAENDKAEQNIVQVASQAAPRPAVDIARLAHELRTPLGAITVLAEIMRDERLGPLGSERYRGYAADIFASAAHANSVLASFLDPVAGAGEPGSLAFVELDLAAVLAGTVSALEPLARRSGVLLRLSLDVPLPHLIADRRCIRQILDNLIANALKFTPPGREVTVAGRYGIGGPVVIEVADAGDGMTAAELARGRAGDAAPEPLRRRSGGTGFGLPLVRALATASGATFGIDSTPGGGTRVTISFPHDHVIPV